MPLTKLKEQYLEEDGVRFLMEDEIGNTVACRVTREALRDHADRVHFSGSHGAVFEAYRELIEDWRAKPLTPKDLNMGASLSPRKLWHE